MPLADHPDIKQSEVLVWEDKFKQEVHPVVQFFPEPPGEDVQQGQEDEIDQDASPQVSMRLYRGKSGVDVSWAGRIMLESDNFIIWEFSIQRDPFIKAKFSINEGNSKLIENLYEFFRNWRDYWSKNLATTNASAAAGAETNPEMGSIQESDKRKKQFIIDNYSDRMQRLAGLDNS